MSRSRTGTTSHRAIAAGSCVAGLGLALTRSPKSGLWNLDTPGELLVKLRNDLKRMQEEPRNASPAYDFFVTAYHMYEWIARDEDHKKELEAVPLVRVAGEIATRAKHLRADHPKWVRLGGMGARMPGPLSRAPGGIPTPLWVALQDPASTPLGRDIVGAIELAECLIQYWTRVLNEGG
jgi:hypothetical protein